MQHLYISNRERLFEHFEDNSAAVIFSGREVRKIGDENYPFTPNSNYFYLTGLDRPNQILLLVKKGTEKTSVLFIEPHDEEKAKWVGDVIKKEAAAEISGISTVKYITELYPYIADVLFNKRIENVYLDLENRYFNIDSIELGFAKEISEKYPYIVIKNIYNDIAELRRIKLRPELAKLKKAVEITGMGIENMLKNVHPDMYEYQLEAYFDFVLRSNGVKEHAFKSIIASGKNAAVLHYSSNDSIIQKGSLVLCDVGAKWQHYCGDITRTFPADGKFTDRQKQLYNIVLAGQKLVIDTIRPGVPFKSLNETLIKYYEKALFDIGLITKPDEVKKYYWHKVSHLLGIETHDAGRHNEGMLEEGMVLTVEPGLYIADENIGIRIEDDVVVTWDGCKIIYDGIPKTAEDIERIMAGQV